MQMEAVGDGGLFERRKIDQQNNNTNRMASVETVITASFIKELFQHPHFQENLKKSHHFQKQAQCPPANIRLSAIVQELSSDLYKEVTYIAQAVQSRLAREIKAVRAQIQKIKEVHLSQASTKVDYFGKQISEDIMFEDEHLFDLPSIKRTINSLQEKMKEISLNSSNILDTSELLRQSKIKEDFVQERISNYISKLEETFTHQHDTFEEIVNKKIEKQQKTINNILETLNQLHSVPKADKQDKNTTLLTASKSAVKLKTFFGFG